MTKQDWVHDDHVRTWGNALTIGFNSFLLLWLPVLFILGFLRQPSGYGFLIAGIGIGCLIYELIVFTYIRVTYLNGELEFRKPLRKYSLLFRKKDQRIQIRPEEWTEVYRYSFKGGTAYYFRKERKAAYFVRGDGLSSFFNDLEQLFPNRVKTTESFPLDIRLRLKKKFPERVM